MHMPRTFYEDFQARWPTWFRAIERRVAQLRASDSRYRVPPAVFADAVPMVQELIVETFKELTASTLTREMELKDRDAARDMIPKISETAAALAAFVLYGKRCFYVQPNLVQRLAHTRLDIDPADIGLPFPYFMLVFDDPISRAAAGEVWPTEGPISVMVYQGRGGEGTAFEGQPALVISPFTPRQFTTRRTSVELNLAGGRIDFDPELPYEHLSWIVLNALDYIDHPWDEAAPVSVKTPSHTTSKKASKLPYISVGHRYAPMQTPPLGTTTADGYKLDHRVFVRGHGRNQRHGPRNSLIKRIRIEPFWKGPDDADVVERPYVVS